MKKLFSIVAMAVILGACNSGTSTGTTTDSTMMTDTTSAAPVMPDTTTMNTPATMAPKDGTMTMKDGKMMVMKAGAWVAMTETMTCTDGCKVMVNGEVKMKDGKKATLKEGEMIDADGHMMDASGNMMPMNK